MNNHPLRNPLATVRGLGSAKEGVGHWWAQRVSAIAIIPLGVCFVYTLLTLMIHGSAFTLRIWLENPLYALPLAALLALMFYHGRLGIQVVIEDYVHHHGLKISLLLANSFLCGAGAIAAVFAILKLHLG